MNDDSDENDGGLETGRVIIVRRMYEDDVIDYVTATDPDGDELGLAEALGMMRLAEDTLIRARMSYRGDEDTD